MTLPKATCRRKDLFYFTAFTVHHEGKWDQELRPWSNDAYLLAQPGFLHHLGLLQRDGTAQPELDLPTSMINQENALQPHLQPVH